MTAEPTDIELLRPETFTLRLAEALTARLAEAFTQPVSAGHPQGEDISFTTRSYKLGSTPVQGTKDLVPVWVRLTSRGCNFILHAQLRMTPGTISATFHGEGQINGTEHAWSGLGSEDEMGSVSILAFEPD